MSNENFGTGVQGTQRNRGKSATEDRGNDKQGSIKVALIVVSIILVLGIGSSLASANVGIWVWLVLAAILSVIASKLENPQVTPSSLLRTTAWVIVATLFLNSGIGMWTKSVVLDTDDWFACRANDNCVAEKRRLEQEEEKEAYRAKMQLRAQRSAAKATPAIPYGLGKEAFLAKVIGSFSPITLEPGEMVGPVGNFKGTCLQHHVVDGTGKLEIWTRPDISSTPVKAEMRGAAVRQLGHNGPVAHQFFKASGKTVTISFERKLENTCS